MILIFCGNRETTWTKLGFQEWVGASNKRKKHMNSTVHMLKRQVSSQKRLTSQGILGTLGAIVLEKESTTRKTRQNEKRARHQRRHRAWR